EIDALLGEEVEDEPFAAEEMLNIDELHLQLAIVNEIVAAMVGRILAGLAVQKLNTVGVGNDADNAPLGRLFNVLQGARRRLAQYFADLQAALGLDHHVLVAAIDRVRVWLKIPEEAHHAMAYNVSHAVIILQIALPTPEVLR